jgi:K+-transporting ATPase ATPase A chain
MSEGIPQNFKPYVKAQTIDSGRQQLIVQGPIASMEPIKLLGSNGGGPTNADASHPYENPTPLTNWLQVLMILLIPAGQIYYFGKMVNNQKHAWSIYTFMLLLFALGAFFTCLLESKGNPLLSEMAFDLNAGNMEGKEQRFGIFGSTIYATATTAVSNGAMNSSHGTFLPWTQGIMLQNMQVGNLIFGGVGTGLYSILHLIMISTFIAALIIGKAPQYLGKKIEAFEMKMNMLPVIISTIGILGLTSLSFLTSWGKQKDGESGPHGFISMLYTFSSTMSNNGSASGNIQKDSVYYNIATSAAMLAGRYLVILATMALAGSLARKKRHPEERASSPISGITFILLILSVYLIINALCYLPALLLGPEYAQILLIERSGLFQ